MTNRQGANGEGSGEKARTTIDEMWSLAKEMGGDFPSVLVFVTAYRGPSELEATLRRMDPRLVELVAEIAVFHRFENQEAEESLERLKATAVRDKIRLHDSPRAYDYGDTLKNCFDYAIDKGFDYVVFLRGDGVYPPESLADFLVVAIGSGCSVVLGDRTYRRGPGTRFSAAQGIKWVANRALSAFTEIILRMNLKDYHCGFRLYSTDILRRIPYHLNSSDYLFEFQMLIQVRALGVPIATVSSPDFHDPQMGLGSAAGYAARSIGVAIGYRLHQLHIIRRGNYLVDLGEKYVLKRNRFSSHMQILNSIESGSSVLELGCGQGLLCEEYARRGIKLVGVDNISPRKVSSFIDNYVRHDLEAPLDIEYGRDFDCVVLSDVIEHLNNRDLVMNSLRRYLKDDGKLIASTGNIAIWFYRISLALGRFEYGPRGILDRTHVHLFTLDSFTRFLRQSGYRILDVSYTPIPFELVFSSTGRSSIVESLTRWYYYLTLLWPRMFAYQFIVHCTFSSYESAQGEKTWGLEDETGVTEKARKRQAI